MNLSKVLASSTGRARAATGRAKMSTRANEITSFDLYVSPDGNVHELSAFEAKAARRLAGVQDLERNVETDGGRKEKQRSYTGGDCGSVSAVAEDAKTEGHEYQQGNTFDEPIDRSCHNPAAQTR